VPLLNNLRFLVGAHKYALSDLKPFYDQPIAPATARSSALTLSSTTLQLTESWTL
jgi:hypothetical protein